MAISRKPTITSHQNGSALMDPVVVGINQTLNIWCTAVNTGSPGGLQGLLWRFSNNSRVPNVTPGERSSSDVYMARYTGYSDDAPTWISILHFDRIQLSSAGMYKCVANYSGMLKGQTMEIQVSSG